MNQDQLVDDLFETIADMIEPCKCSECRHDARDHTGSLPEVKTKAKIANVLAKHLKDQE